MVLTICMPLITRLWGCHVVIGRRRSLKLNALSTSRPAPAVPCLSPRSFCSLSTTVLPLVRLGIHPLVCCHCNFDFFSFFKSHISFSCSELEPTAHADPS
ncbi:hypothetical protein B0H19DRAFT_1136833, partial [Mycena capillaripes]